MSQFVRIRCPVCGMLSYLRNLGHPHNLDVYTVTFGGKVIEDKDIGFGALQIHNKGRGKAKGLCVWEKTNLAGPNTIEEFWTKYLIDSLINVSIDIRSDMIPNVNEILDKLLIVAKRLDWEEPEPTIITKTEIVERPVYIEMPIATVNPYIADTHTHGIFNYGKHAFYDSRKQKIYGDDETCQKAKNKVI